MPLRFLADRQLYSDYRYYCDTFRWEAAPDTARLLRFHGYWAGTLDEHHELCLKSLLLTQSPPRELWVWMPPADLARNHAFIASFDAVPGIAFKAYVMAREAGATLLSPHLGDVERRLSPRATSDVVRLVLLAKYGGVYFDFDNLFLRDLRPLCDAPFVYQWSNQPFATNAVSYFPQDSETITAMCLRCLDRGSSHPRDLLRFEDADRLPGDTLVLPSFVFDPIWIPRDLGLRVTAYCNTFDDFFNPFTDGEPPTLAEFFPHSYCYDWHRQWDRPILPGTIAGALHAEITAAFDARFAIDAGGRS